jgi:hypothetical protein
MEKHCNKTLFLRRLALMNHFQWRRGFAFHFIERSQSLKKFELMFVSDASVVLRFIAPASRNSLIKEIRLIFLNIPTDSLESYLCHSKNLTKFAMESTSIEVAYGVSKAQAIAAFSQNKAIEQLILCNLEESILIPLLNHLKSNTSIKQLDISWLYAVISDQVSKSIQQLLKESATLQTIELGYGSHFKVSTFGLFNRN